MRIHSALNPLALLPLLLVLLGFGLHLAEPLPIQVLRNGLFDQFQRWSPREYRPAPVRIVDIDDDSLARLGQWPWPRTRIAELIDQLRAGEVAAIGFDVVFAEPDRTSPKAVLDLWRIDAGTRQALATLPDHDATLAETIAQQPDVVLGFAAQRGAAAQPLDHFARPWRYVFAGDDPSAYLPPFQGAVTALPPLQDAAAGNGGLTFVPDADGIVRRVPLALRIDTESVPTLAAESLRVAQGERNHVLHAAAHGAGIEAIRIGQFSIPTTSSGELWLHYTEPRPERYIPAWQVLDGSAPAEALAGHIVLIGSSAQGLMDLRASPMGRIIPGVEAHAQALEQILTGHYLLRPHWAVVVEAGALLLLGLLVGGLAMYASAMISAAITVVAVTGIGAGAWFGFTQQGFLLDPVTPALVVLASFVISSLIHHFRSERRQRWVKQAFARYVSPNLVNHLVESPGALELGGKRQTCSFIFTDLAGFTSLMESIDPGEAVALLNSYLDQMIAIAFRHEGTLDRIVGDAVAIMFSAPVPQPDHQRRALICALEMQAFAHRYADELNARGIRFGQTRIGVHSGEVIVGNFGGSTIFDYRALGDPVNTAARLESVNKHLGTRICVSEVTLAGCPDALVRPVGRLVLKGKSKPLMVFEPLIDAGGPDRAYEAAFKAMRDEDPDALAAFRALAEQRPDDPLVKLHIKRLESGQSGDLIVMSEK